MFSMAAIRDALEEGAVTRCARVCCVAMFRGARGVVSDHQVGCWWRTRCACALLGSLHARLCFLGTLHERLCVAGHTELFHSMRLHVVSGRGRALRWLVTGPGRPHAALRGRMRG